MERLTIRLVSVVERDDIVVARARAEPEQARIWIEVRFRPSEDHRDAELWQEARDQVLRYLDGL